MEKRVFHYRLAVVRLLVDQGRLRATRSAIAGAAALDMDFAAMVEVVRTLTVTDFYKSMTTHADHKV